MLGTVQGILLIVIFLMVIVFIGLALMKFIEFLKKDSDPSPVSSSMNFSVTDLNEEKRVEIADRLKLPHLSDVAGLSEVKEELSNIMNVFKDAYEGKTKVKPPSGVLLYGAPGCGKTMLAKAIARECKVNFIARNAGELCRESMYSSSLDNAISKLFKDARKNKPCIIFIDELDIFGSRSEMGNGRKELTQLIAEMDGFASNEGVLVIGATNNLLGLDQALLRAGRFTKKFHIAPPQLNEDVEDVINRYCNKEMLVNVSDDVLLRMCRGMSPADMKAMFEMAETNSVIYKKKVTQLDLLKLKTELFSKDIFSLRNRFSQDDILRQIAVHEVGHTILNQYFGRVTEGVNIYGIGSAAGLTISSQLEKESMSPLYLIKQSVMIEYSGVLNEELYYGLENVFLGCTSDIENATKILVAICSDVSLVQNDEILLNYSALLRSDLRSPETQQISTYIVSLSKQLVKETKDILQRNKSVSDKLVDLLVKRKELSNSELNEFFISNPIIH